MKKASGVVLAVAWSMALPMILSCTTGVPADQASNQERGATTPTQDPAPPQAAPSAPSSPATGPATGTAPAQAGAPAVDPPWVARYDFALEVDGRPSPDACFYQEVDSRRILVNAPELSRACIITVEGARISAVDRSKVKLEGDGDAARLLPGTQPEASGTYTVDQKENSVVFYLGSNRLKILPKMPLVGPTGPEEISRHSPVYRKGKETYVPAPADIAALKAYGSPLEIEVFFGTWCPHCKVLVPKFMKAIEQAGNAKVKVSYHGVPREFGSYEPARAKNVTGIPTFIFWKDGREVGRIPGEPTNGTIEHAVAEILGSIPR